MPGDTAFRESFRRVRSLLLDLMAEHPAAAPRATEAFRAVEQLEERVDGLLGTSARGADRRARGKPKTYQVEQAGDEEVLAEYRPDDEIPFRCPRVTYDALAKVFAKSDRFLKYEEVMRLLAREIKPVPADYQVRVILRFWAQPDVGLIERSRARYRSGRSSGFAEAAKRAWKNAAVVSH